MRASQAAAPAGPPGFGGGADGLLGTGRRLCLRSGIMLSRGARHACDGSIMPRHSGTNGGRLQHGSGWASTQGRAPSARPAPATGRGTANKSGGETEIAATCRPCLRPIPLL
ncbi:MAG: hypothetical protein OXU61_11085 [Gammaproteobacteria bacterium]|nr:hypothetical protein [Gammaproteobacteria bacterium]